MSLKTGVIFAFLGSVILTSGLAYPAPKGKSISTPAQEKETIVFRGTTLGSSESVLKEKFPEFDCENASANYPLADRRCVASTELEKNKCEIAFISNLIGKIAFIECQIAAESVENVTKAWVYGGASASVVANYINDALVRVDISIALTHYQSIMEALITKYGKPARVKKQEVRNKMGAKFEDEESTWMAGGVTLTLQKYGRDLTKSSVTYILDSSVAEVTNRMKKGTSEAAKSL